MMTTRARDGNARDSVTAGRLIEQPPPGRAGHHGRSRLEPLHGPAPEVELDRAAGVLDRPPQRPSVLAYQPQDLGARYLIPQKFAVVPAHEGRESVGGQAAFAPDVAELETGIVVARVLVVDEPDLRAVVDEVRGQQVVVARHGARLADREGLAGRGHLWHQLRVPGRDGEPARGGHGQVAPLDLEHVEVAGEPRTGVQATARLRDPGDVAGVGQVFVMESTALYITEHEQALLGPVGDDRRA